jgi:hypothetical protein
VRLASWVRHVLTADVGEHEPVPIYLERSREEDGYVFRLGVRAGFGGQETARIPVCHRTNRDPHPILKEIHYCEVAGRTLEAANVYALQEKVGRLLEAIAPARTLPLCYFRVPAMDYELPVYEQGGALTSPVLGGPKLKARDLAGIRSVVCRYLVSAGYVRDMDEVIVGVVRPRDLRRVPPAAVFRSLLDPGLWLPSVEGVSPEGPVVGVVGHSPRLRAPERRRAGAGPAAQETAPAAPDVVALLRFLRAELARGGSPEMAGSLYAAEVREEIWAAAEARTQDSGRHLVAYLSDAESTRLELAIRSTGAGDVATALEDRGINVFLAPDENALASFVGRYLAKQEFLRFAEEVEVHAAAAPRAERLAVEAIRTDGGGDSPPLGGQSPSETTDEPKEVQAAWS